MSAIHARDERKQTGLTVMIPGIAPDGSLYPIEKLAAHRAGRLHLAISAFVFSGDDLLIQRRAAGKYHCAGQWANTCCTHPHWGESVESAAVRRLSEELGFTLPLRRARTVEYRAVVGDGLIEHERVHMFVGRADRDTLRVEPDPDEVSETRWASPADLRREMAATPEAFTPWFRIYLDQFPDLSL
jgi:isopentenyl-diphosphate Delta-isomerase